MILIVAEAQSGIDLKLLMLWWYNLLLVVSTYSATNQQ